MDACWITTCRVRVSCDTTVTRVAVNAVSTRVEEAARTAAPYVDFIGRERERGTVKGERGEKPTAMARATKEVDGAGPMCGARGGRKVRVQ